MLRKGKTAQSGYILIFVIWMLALIAVSATYLASRVGELMDRAFRTQQDIQARIDMNDANAEIMFRLATTQLTPYGLGVGEGSVRLDGREYLDGRGVRVSIQDGRGLLNLNQINDETLDRFLAAQGIEYAERSRMLDTLRDYTDEDNLKRLNGAEGKDYEEAGLSPPRNVPLVTPREIARIMGWEKHIALARYFSVAGVGGLNPNTAERPVLFALPGINDRIADELLLLRSIPQLITDSVIMQYTGLSAESYMLTVNSFPSDVARITLSADNFPWKLETTLKLTPLGERAPWQVYYYYKLANDKHAEQSNAVPVPLPARAQASIPASNSPFD